jgi:DNA-binding winged helix-turn-helix (wHTH) protein
MPEKTLIYEFHEFRIDMERRVLVRHGEPVTVTPKALDILLFFVQNKGKVLGKDEFMKVLWPESFVEEGNLSQHVFLLRKILGDGLNVDRFIMTIPRRGYMFVAPVREIDSTILQDESSARIHSKRSSQPPAVLGGTHLSDRNEQSKVELDVVLQEEASGTGNLSTNREDVIQQETERNRDSFRSVRVGEDDESINKIAALVCKGRCILVLGAAVHDPPPEGSEYSYPENERPLLGHELAQYLASKSDFIEPRIKNVIAFL